MDVVNAGLVVPAWIGRRIALGGQFLEEVGHLLAANDAGKRAILAPHTDTRMQHHEHEERRLTLGETQRRDRADTFGVRHPRNSSKMRGSGLRPEWPPRPPTPVSMR